MHSATNLHCIHYTDDSNVFTRDDSNSELTNFFSDELCKVFTWICANYLCLNVEKSCFIAFKNKNIKVMHVLKIAKINLYFSSETKFLGIIIENKLLFAKHISNRCSKCWTIKKIEIFSTLENI